MKYDLSILIPSRLSVFGGVSSSSLTLFFKPILSLWPLHPSLVTQIITSWTISAPTFLCSKLVSVFTVGLLGLLGNLAYASQNIFSLSHQLKMFGITARGIATKVIKGIQASSNNPSRYWGYKQSIHNSMYSFSAISVPEQPIPHLIFRASPVPTLRSRVFRYFGINTFMLFQIELNYQVFHKLIIPQEICI